MALTGVQIYKFLPKTNCKECGYPTCLSFAMKGPGCQSGEVRTMRLNLSVTDQNAWAQIE